MMRVTVAVRETFRPYSEKGFQRWCDGVLPRIPFRHRMAFTRRLGRPRNQYVETQAALWLIRQGHECWTYYRLFRATEPRHKHHVNSEEIRSRFTSAQVRALQTICSTNGGRLREPDVLAFDPKRKRWFAYEVKRAGEGFRPGQLEALAALHYHLGMRVGVIRFGRKNPEEPIIRLAHLHTRQLRFGQKLVNSQGRAR